MLSRLFSFFVSLLDIYVHGYDYGHDPVLLHRFHRALFSREGFVQLTVHSGNSFQCSGGAKEDTVVVQVNFVHFQLLTFAGVLGGDSRGPCELSLCLGHYYWQADSRGN